jgi:hypothetical protein
MMSQTLGRDLQSLETTITKVNTPTCGIHHLCANPEPCATAAPVALHGFQQHCSTRRPSQQLVFTGELCPRRIEKLSTRCDILLHYPTYVKPPHLQVLQREVYSGIQSNGLPDVTL